MRIARLREGITFTSQDYDKVLADPDLKVGYEIEFIASEHSFAPQSMIVSVDEILKSGKVLDYFEVDAKSAMPMYKDWLAKTSKSIAAKSQGKTTEKFVRDLQHELGRYGVAQAAHTTWDNDKVILAWAAQAGDSTDARAKLVYQVLSKNYPRVSLWLEEIGESVEDITWAQIWNRLHVTPLTSWANDQHTQVNADDDYDSRLRQLVAAQHETTRELNQLDLGHNVEWDTSGLGHWNLTEDGSIKPDRDRPGYGLELVSPPDQIEPALLNLKKVFDWMESRGHYTNDSTGFHVGVSIGEKIGQVDKLKLLLLLDEQYVMKLFNRQLNTYTTSHLNIVKDAIADARRQGKSWTNIREVQKMVSVLNASLDDVKYRTVNFSKLENGYLEFRIMGNRDYDKRFEQVKNTILRYGFVLMAAVDPNAFRKEYMQELGRLISRGLAEARPEYPDLVSKYAVVGAGPMSKEQINNEHLARINKYFDSNQEDRGIKSLAKLIAKADKYADTADNANVINAASLAYRILLKRRGFNTTKFARAMTKYQVDPSVRAGALHYLKTY